MTSFLLHCYEDRHTQIPLVSEDMKGWNILWQVDILLLRMTKDSEIHSHPFNDFAFRKSICAIFTV